MMLPAFHRKAQTPVEWRRDEQEIFMEHVKSAVRGERYGKMEDEDGY